MKDFIDLHIHSNLSDGELSPKEIIDLAFQNNVTTISITDHDTIEAYSNNLIEYAKSKNIKLITGVEISSKTKKCGIHILGYNFDINNIELKEKLSLIRNSRHNYLHNVGIKLNSLGYFLNIEELDKIDAVSKANIAIDIITNPRNHSLLLKTFGHIPDKGEFIETIMNEGCPAYVTKDCISPKEVANLIRRAGGKVVLAHPVAYQYEDNLSDTDILEIVLDMKADGIEVNYIYIDKNHTKVNEIEKWNAFAKKHNLITTIGSDFHKQDGIHPELGLITENI